MPGRRFRVVAEPDLPPGLADENRQLQILQNLLTNAAKFSAADSTVEITIRRDGDEIVVHVRDDGIGIAADGLTRLFRPFARLLPREGAASKGTGLGLYIAKALVEGQGGQLWVDSEEGRGSTFSYTVPVADATREPATP
jgi:signal transduction histidine kinase